MARKFQCVIVDDEESILSMMHYLLLQTCPHAKVIKFVSSIHALEFSMRNCVDLIITDYRMPILDGLELTAKVRRHNPSVPILIMSGEDVAYKAVEAGANGFIEKIKLPAELGAALQFVGLPVYPSVTHNRSQKNTTAACCVDR